jgi:Tfp pilus assembly protein PilF
MTQARRAKPQLGDRTLELALSALRHHDTTSARFLSEAVISAAPERADAHVALGTVLLTIGDRSGGLATWRHALALDPNFPGLRERLAEQSRR